jgi:hypothetical protein
VRCGQGKTTRGGSPDKLAAIYHDYFQLLGQWKGVDESINLTREKIQ